MSFPWGLSKSARAFSKRLSCSSNSLLSVDVKLSVIFMWLKNTAAATILCFSSRTICVRSFPPIFICWYFGNSTSTSSPKSFNWLSLYLWPFNSFWGQKILAKRFHFCKSPQNAAWTVLFRVMYFNFFSLYIKSRRWNQYKSCRMNGWAAETDCAKATNVSKIMFEFYYM